VVIIVIIYTNLQATNLKVPAGRKSGEKGAMASASRQRFVGDV